MKIIGICGGIGSGKSAVSNAFAKHGITTLNTDLIYHEITSAPSPCLAELSDHFGTDIIVNGALDRKKLSSMVFATEDSARQLEVLNKITHKHVLNEVRARIARLANEGKRLVAVEVPLLFESGFDKECDFIVSVLANKETRISRIIRRDGITRQDAERRIAVQISDEWLSQHSDFVVYNDLGLDELERQVDKILNDIS